MRHDIIKFLIVLGTMLLSFFSSLLLLTAATFFLSKPVSWYHLPVAAIIAAGIGWFGTAKYFPGQRYIVGLLLLLVAASAVVCLRVGASYDNLSVDGQTYHAEAIMELASGWNPLEEPAPSNSIYPVFLSFYPKGPWITGAALVQTLAAVSHLRSADPYTAKAASLEQVKSINLLLTITAFCFASAALLTFRKLKWYTVVVLGLLLVLNPVNVSQLLGFYVDGQLSSCLLILVSVALLLYRKQDWPLYTAFAAVTLLTINVKLTGGLYALILGGGFAIWYCLTRTRQRKVLLSCFVTACLLGAVFVGYNPYITQYLRNYVAHGDPFYPTDLAILSGAEHQIPSNFSGLNPWQRLFASLFSRTQDDQQPSQLKLPFTASEDEFQAMAVGDPRVAGLGPLFGGACILTLVIAVFVAVKTFRQRRNTRLITALVPMLFLLLLSALVNTESWWLRYVPQLWVIPLLIAVLALNGSPRGQLYGLTYVLIALLIFNVGVTAYIVFEHDADGRVVIEDQMISLRQISLSKPIYVSLNGSLGTRYRLTANAINFLEVVQLPCQEQDRQNIEYSLARYCVP